MRNNSYAPHYAIGRYSIREFKTGAEPFMVAMIIIIIIIRLVQIGFRMNRSGYLQNYCENAQRMRTNFSIVSKS